jgi:hypothetical protein
MFLVSIAAAFTCKKALFAAHGRHRCLRTSGRRRLARATRGDVYRLRLSSRRGREQRGARYAVVVQADELLGALHRAGRTNLAERPGSELSARGRDRRRARAGDGRAAPRPRRPTSRRARGVPQRKRSSGRGRGSLPRPCPQLSMRIEPTRPMRSKWSSQVRTVVPLRAAVAAIQMSLVGTGVPALRSSATISA